MLGSAFLAADAADRAVHRDDLLGRQALALVVQAVNVLGVEPGELAVLVQQLDKSVADGGPPLPLLRAEDEGAAHFEVGELVGEEH